MSITWPLTLQQLLNNDSWTYKLGDTNVRSNMDTGPQKVRRRFTHGIDNMSCAIVVNKSQYEIFMTFYKVSLNSGINSFEFNDPITSVSCTWRFIAPPSIGYIGGEYFKLNMDWEKLP